MAFCFNHFNFNVTNLETSLAFYEKALGLKENGRIEAEDGSYVIVYLGDGKTGFRLELTWLKDHPQKYDLGECEFHLAITADNYQEALKFHQKKAGFVLSTRRWEFISLRIRTVIGLKFCRRKNKSQHKFRRLSLDV